MTNEGFDALIDLERYPIEDLTQADACALIETCQAQLAATGACVLEGFIRPTALSAILAEVDGSLDKAHYLAKDHNPYLVAEDPAYPGDHPRNRPQRTDSATLANDLFPPDCRLEQIYRWPALQNFVATLLDYEALHPYEDPLSPLNILVYRPGCQTGWHFDGARFVVTVMLQTAESGGLYQYAPFVRSEEDEGFEPVGRILDGDQSGVLELKQGPGALVLFKGHDTLHRVTAVEGDRTRLIGVFSYAPEPGKVLPEHTRRIFYGRAA